MITADFKTRVVDAIKAQAERYPSAKKQAVALDVSPAQLSRIKAGERSKILSESKWITLGRKLGVEINPGVEWNTAKTPAFEAITAQLESCQRLSIAAVLCDVPDLGKTHTAKIYTRQHKNVVYIDCSQVKSKQLFVRRIAQEFGVDHTGKYVDVYQDLTYYLRSIDRPLVILDEAGDLKMEAFLELKALWNATERACGWYMMGADGLKARIERQRALKKVGYAEIFRRYGSRFQKISPDGGEELERFRREQFALVAKANKMNDVQKLYAKSAGSLERARIEYEKRTQQI